MTEPEEGWNFKSLSSRNRTWARKRKGACRGEFSIAVNNVLCVYYYPKAALTSPHFKDRSRLMTWVPIQVHRSVVDTVLRSQPRHAAPRPHWLALVAVLLPAAAQAQENKPLRVAVVKSFFRDVADVNVKVMTLAIGGLLHQHTGLKAEVGTGTDADQLADQIDKGKLDLALVQGYEFAWLQQTHPKLKPLLVALNHKPYRPVLLVTRAGSTITSFADLKGKQVSLALRSVAQCHLFLHRHCVKCGHAPDKYFAKIVEHASVEEGLDAVAAGGIDAAIVDSLMLEFYAVVKPSVLPLLQTVEKSAPFPAAVVIYREGSLPVQTLDSFRTGMAKANTDPKSRALMTLLRFTGFESVPADYQKALDQIREAYPAPANGCS